MGDHRLEKRLPTLRLAQVPNAVGLVVLKLMTRMAKRDAVPDVEPQFGVICERSKVMRPKVAARIISALSASETISTENEGSPLSIFRSTPIIRSALASSMAVRIVRFAARSSLPRYCRNLRNGLGGVLGAHTTLVSSARFRELFFGFVGVVPSLECRNSSLRRHPFLDASARPASGRQPVMSARIAIEARVRMPTLARPAPFFTIIHASLELLKGQSGLCRNHLHRACLGLCHAQDSIPILASDTTQNATAIRRMI